MGRFEYRLARLERAAGAKHWEQQLVYLGPNLESDDAEETPYSVRIEPGVWAEAFGRPFESEAIAKLKGGRVSPHLKGLQS
jgi:hypothetical protein